MTEKEVNAVIAKAFNTEKAKALRSDVERAVLAYADYLAEATGVHCVVSVTPHPPDIDNTCDTFVYQPIKRPMH
jgi:hypothetical protein